MQIAIVRLAAVSCGAAARRSPPRPGARPGDAALPAAEPKQVDWSFAGPFGKYDPAAIAARLSDLQGGLLGLPFAELVAFRTSPRTAGPHFTRGEVKALAAEATRSGRPERERRDVRAPGQALRLFPARSPTVSAARAHAARPLADRQGARVERGFPTFVFDIFTQYQEGGPDYIHALLTGFTEPPAGVKVPEGIYYNPYFISGQSLAMPPPLSDGQVSYGEQGRGQAERRPSTSTRRTCRRS